MVKDIGKGWGRLMNGVLCVGGGGCRWSNVWRVGI